MSQPHATASNFPRAVLPLVLAFVMASCVSYDEVGVVHPDGSGAVRIAIGLARDNVDHQKIGEVKSAVARFPGLRWISTIDSFAGSRRWTGAVIGFDSVEALRPLNEAIALESLFGKISLAETDSGMVLRRSILLPSGSRDDHDFNRIRWTFPGRVVETDKWGRIDSTGSGVRWNLPLGDGHKLRSQLVVRWKRPILPGTGLSPSWPWNAGMRTPTAWLLPALQILVLMGLALLSILLRTKVRDRIRTLAREGFMEEPKAPVVPTKPVRRPRRKDGAG